MSLINVAQKYLASTLQDKDNIIIIENDRSYSALDFLNIIGMYKQLLIKEEINTGDFIGIAMEKSIFSIAAIYAVLLSNATYVPIDMKLPDANLAYQIKNIRMNIILGDNQRPPWCADHTHWIELPKTIVSDIDASINDLFDQSPQNNIAVILSSSGTTANPKGIMISHAAIDVFVEWTKNEFKLGKGKQVISTAPLFFDLSFFDIFSTIFSGATLNIPSKAITMFPTELSRYLKERHITHWYTVPSYLSFWLNKGAIENHLPLDMEVIMFAGEKFPINQLIRLSKHLEDTNFYNLFGPTETNVCCYWELNRDTITYHVSVPIGKATPYCQIKLTADQELLVKGKSLASKVIKDGTVIDLVDAEGWYHTGDLCEVNEDNELAFLDRKDRCFKSYGYQIIPTEIENVVYVYNQSCIKECFILPINDTLKNKVPVLIIVSEQDVHIEQLRSFLKSQLAIYLLPKNIIQLDNIPKLSNGKTDMVKLTNIAQEYELYEPA